MDESVIVGLLSLAGTLGGSLLGILTANKLVNYRLEQLEKKVDKHNNLVERLGLVERKTDLLDERVRVANHRIEDLEGTE